MKTVSAPIHLVHSEDIMIVKQAKKNIVSRF